MGLQKYFDQFEDGVALHDRFGLDWSLKGCGFGQLYFYEKDGKIYCQNECMSREAVRHIMNTLVDQCVLEDDVRGKAETQSES